MTAYLICRVKVHDTEVYQTYTPLSAAAVAKYEGRFLVRGGHSRTLEGPECTERLVVVEFASLEAAQRFYDSPEYQAAKKIREGYADGQFVIVEGAA